MSAYTYPKITSVVDARVSRHTDDGIYVTFPDYGNMEGFVPMVELGLHSIHGPFWMKLNKLISVLVRSYDKGVPMCSYNRVNQYTLQVVGIQQLS